MWRKTRKILQVLDGKYVIGNIGRFSNVKNRLFLLEIFLEVLKLRVHFQRVLICGEKLKDCVKRKATLEKLILD